MKRGVMQGFIYLRRGQPGPLKPPVDDLADIASPEEITMSENVMRESAAGSPTSAKNFIEKFLERTQADELVLTCHARDHEARIKSFGIGAEILNGYLNQ